MAITRDVTYYSDGFKLAATLYLPEGRTQPLPVALLCHGLRADRKVFMPAFAEEFVKAGYAALIPDYRGFGDSEGARHRLISREREDDIINALTFLATLSEIDSARVGLFGISYGGATAIGVAARDPRVRCVVSVVTFGDGDRWMRNSRRLWEYFRLREAVERDRVRRVIEGASEYVDFSEILVATPAEEALYKGQDLKALRITLPLETADDIMSYRPERVVHEIAPRPLLLIAGDKDYLVGWEESVRLHELAHEPKELMILPGLTHYQVYSDGFRPTIEAALRTFRSAMG
jgi:predicted acyl esterase